MNLSIWLQAGCSRDRRTQQGTGHRFGSCGWDVLSCQRADKMLLLSRGTDRASAGRGKSDLSILHHGFMKSIKNATHLIDIWMELYEMIRRIVIRYLNLKIILPNFLWSLFVVTNFSGVGTWTTLNKYQRNTLCNAPWAALDCDADTFVEAFSVSKFIKWGVGKVGNLIC